MTGLPIRCEMVSIVVLQGRGAATRMLLLRRAGGYMDGAWAYVAGHVEADERGWQAARRELREETGLVPEALYASSHCEQFYDPGKDCIQIVPAFVARVAEGAEVTLNSEHSAYDWLPLHEAMQVLPFGSQRDLLAHVQREFIERMPPDVQRMPDA